MCLSACILPRIRRLAHNDEQCYHYGNANSEDAEGEDEFQEDVEVSCREGKRDRGC